MVDLSGEAFKPEMPLSRLVRIRYRHDGDRLYLRLEDYVQDEARVWKMLQMWGVKVGTEEDSRKLEWRKFIPKEAYPKLAKAAGMLRARLAPEEGEAPLGAPSKAREAYERARPVDVPSLLEAAKAEASESAERALHEARVRLDAWARDHPAYGNDAKADLSALDGALRKVMAALAARRAEAEGEAVRAERELLRGVAAEDAWRAHEALRRLKEMSQAVRFEEAEVAPVDVPDDIPGFRGRLRPYQLEGVRFLVSRGLSAILADEMGLGKTVMAVAAICESGEKALVVAPANVLYNWAEEVERFTGETALVWHGQRLQGPPGARFLVTTYDALRSLPWKELEREVGARPVLVLDEAHLIRNPETQRAKLVRALPQKRRMLLTGTPLVNAIEDYYELLQQVAPHRWGSRENFRETWLVDPELFNKYAEVRAATASLLQRAARRVLLRRRKEEVLPDLPPRTIQVRRHELEGGDLRAYRQLEERAAEALREARSKVQVFAAVHALRQHLANARVAGVRERLGELLDAGEAAVVYSHYLEPLRALKRELGDAAAMLTGETPPRERQRIATSLGRRGGPRIVLAQMEAGGIGLNLTGARHVLFIHFGWTPAVHAQAMDRVHRIGQDLPVFVEFFVTPGTLDDRLASILLRKQADQNLVLAEGGDLFNEGELLRLLAEEAAGHVDPEGLL